MGHDLAAELTGAVGGAYVQAGADAPEYRKDEALGASGVEPDFVVWPASAPEVADVLRIAASHRVPVTARGSGTGMSGGAIPSGGGAWWRSPG